MATGTPSTVDDGTDDATNVLDERSDSVEDASSERIEQVEEGATIDPALLNESGTTTIVVRMEEADVSASATRASAVDTLQTHADQAQKPVMDAANRMEGAEVVNRYWIANAVLLEVDLDAVDLRDLAQIEGVTRLHENFEMELVGGPTTESDDETTTESPTESESETTESTTETGSDTTNSSTGDETVETTTENETSSTESDDGATSDSTTESVATDSPDVTYGLEQTNASEVWRAYDTMGSGVKVAVLDTGVDASHPDIDLYTEDPDDPTHPGGWANFTTDGELVAGSEPHDDGMHGTHTSGTIVGGNASGEYIGVAPGASLIHGQVLGDAPGTFTRVAAGMEWAVQQDADLISMSLGAPGHQSDMVEPVLNAEDAGVLVVASAGNEGEGTTGSPGNVYESFAIGASNENYGIASFSSGEAIHTSTAWGDDAPENWPDMYIVPDVSAPGVDVKSAEPGDSYQQLSGTSMAAPHVAGGVALLLAASGEDLTNEEIRSAFRRGAWKPTNCDPSCDPRNDNDTRYGAGLIDVKRTTDLVALNSGLDGTVTDADGDPVEGASVDASGFIAETNAAGEYDMGVLPGDHDVTASAFGYESKTKTATIVEGSYTTTNFSLGPDLGVEKDTDIARAVEDGDEVTATFTVANLETLTVEMTGNYAASDATLEVDGTEYAFGEPIQFSEPKSGELTITADTDYGTTGDFSLSSTFEGEGSTQTIDTGPTDVFDEFSTVGVVGERDDGMYVDNVVDTLDEELPLKYKVERVNAENATEAAEDGDYDVYVVQAFGEHVSEGSVESFIEETDGPQTGVVYLDQHGDYSDGIDRLSDATGDPDATHQGPYNDYVPVSYEVEADHPILGDVAGAGDTVEIHSVQYAHHSWFTGYDGEVIADVSDGREVNGPGLGVDDTSRTVLASSLGRSFFTPDHLFSNESNRILTNSIEWASTTPPVVFQDEQATHRAPTEEISTEVAVDQLDELTVSLGESTTVSEDELTLYVDGNVASFDQSLAYDSLTDESVTITVVPDDDAVGSVSLDYEFVAGDDDRTIPASTGPTAVYERPLDVPTDVDTLTEAVELAPEDAEIVVDDGTYEEQVNVDTDGLTIRSAEGATPTIKVPSDHSWNDPYYLLNLAAENLTFTGFHMSGELEGWSSYTGASLEIQGSNVSVSDVSIESGDAGIQLGEQSNQNMDAEHVDVSNVTIEDVDGYYGQTAVIGSGTDVNFDDLTIDNTRTGIDLEGQVNVTNSTITNVTGTSFGEGTAVMLSYGDDPNHVRNNTIAHVEKGIELFYADDVAVTSNDIDDAGVGIVSDDGAYADPIAHNNVTDSEVGLLLQSALNGGSNATMNVVEAETGILVEKKYISVSPESIRVRYNDLESSDVAMDSTVERGPIDARLNYFGERGPATANVEGDAVYDPFMTKSPGELDVPESEMEQTKRIGTDLEMEAGEKYALGIPGPSAGTLADVMGEDFTGAAYSFDSETQSWELLKGKDHVGALDAILVIPEEDTRAVVSFDTSDSAPAGPGQQELDEGWNFLSAPQYTDAEDAFEISSGTPRLAMSMYEQPESQLGQPSEMRGTYEFRGASVADGPNVSAFTGYFVYSEESGTIPAYLHGDTTMDQLYDGLDVEPDIDDASEPTDAEVRAAVESAASDAAREAALRNETDERIEDAANAAATAVVEDLPESVSKHVVESAVEQAVADAQSVEPKTEQSGASTEDESVGNDSTEDASTENESNDKRIVYSITAPTVVA